MLLAPILAAIVLAGDPVSFDAAQKPLFNDNQIRNTAGATRTGLARWAATGEGRRILGFLHDNDLVVTVTEDGSEPGLGRAPDPRLAILVATSKHTHVRNFEIVLNPQFFRLPEGWVPLKNEPATPDDAMAAAWAGEMLHVYFYARGIELPHHSRADFQDEWQEVAAELGMPALTHDDEHHVRVRHSVSY